MWSQQEAVKLCVLVEKIVKPFGFHVALTGGCLYGEGARKDVDLILYKVRQNENPKIIDMRDALQDAGIKMLTPEKFCREFCTKAQWSNGNNIDILYPESTFGIYPAKSDFVAVDIFAGLI